MSVTLFAQPYNAAGSGFYFESEQEFGNHLATLRHAYGDAFQECEIRFIDGEDIDCEFAKAVGLNQANLKRFIELVDAWDVHQKINYIIAVGECGYTFDLEKDDIDQLEDTIDVYEEASMRNLAMQFVDEGLFGEVPEAFQNYIDYDAIARDLSIDYTQIILGVVNLIYRCA